MTHRSRLFAAAALATVGGLLLVGCSSPTSSSDGGSGETPPLTVDMAFSGSVIQSNFNPFLSSATQGTRNYMFQTLMNTDIINGGEFTPWLASGYELSEDGRTLTVHVEPEATWSDGTPVTAEDVRFTLQLAKDNPALNQRGAQFETVTAVDDKTVEFTFAEPGSTLLAGIFATYIVPKAQWEGVDAQTFTNDQPVVSGPYELGRFSPQQVTLSLREDYWRTSDIQVETINMPIINSSTLVSQLERGQVDVSGAAIPNLIDGYVSTSDQHGYFYPTYGGLYLVFNHDVPALQDVRVRRAVMLAMDKPQQIELVTQVGAQPISQTGLDATTLSDWLDPQYTEPVERDLEGARAELEQAGYTFDADGRAIGPDGAPLTLSYGEVGDFADSVQRARIISQQLAEIGITVNVETAASSTYSSERANGGYDLVGYGFAYGNTPYVFYNSMLNSSLAGGEDGSPSSYANYGRWRDEETDAALDRFAAASAVEEQREAGYELQRIVTEEVPFVTLSNITAGCAYTTANWTGFPSEDDPYGVCAPWFAGSSVEDMLAKLEPAGS
ncbi:ABC transporter substrate-binding protein [Desertihabitans aurantiacus]|uniref:ABC transporter substrate-binding protein n=1 Tax=Desertihabitans aurantiacus TaxID=2282477 RepID=UPI000DF8024A|nr:ABC transporter substrate-binding protein [Desertihabitans aurantiacus]